MKTLLTHGYFLAEDAQEQRVMRPYPPLGILYLAAWLDQGSWSQPSATSCTIRFDNYIGLLILPDRAGYTFASSPFYIEGCGSGWVHVKENDVARYGATTATEDRPRLEALSAQAGIRDADVVARRFLAKMVVHTALPSVDGGGMAGRPSVAVAERPGAFLAGDWVGPVGLLADASFASGEVAGGIAAAHAVAHARAARSGAARSGRSATVATSVP